MKRLFPSLQALFLLLPAHGAVVTSTGFESPEYSTGNLPNTGTLPVRVTGTANNSAVIVGSSSPFGGASNQHLDLDASIASNTFVVRATTTVTTLSTYAFDLYEPTGTSGTLAFGIAEADLNNNTGNGAYTGWSINNGAIGRASFTDLASGIAPSLSENTVYRAFVFYNGNAGTASVAIPTGGDASVAAGQTALFFYNYATGALIDGGRYSTSGTNTPTLFMFRAFTSSDNRVLIDNFVHDNTLTFGSIPEPSSGAILVTAGLLLLRRPRKI